MAQFKKAGTPVGGMLNINVGHKVVIDYFGDPGRDILSDLVATVGITASINEIKSPMPKVIRRFEIGGTSVGPSTLIAHPAGLNVKLVVSLTPEDEFITTLAAASATVAKNAGVPMSILLGVACVESGFGKGPHANKNLFGITKRDGQNWFPSCSTTAPGTTEAIAGKGNTGDTFCMASSLENNAKIFCEFITGHPGGGPLKPLLKVGGSWTRAELEKFPTSLHDNMNFGMGKSAQQYREAVMGVIDFQQLTRFDPKPL